MNGVLEGIGALTVIFMVVAYIVFGPFASVWALNVFGFSVPYTFKTWVAGALLLLLFGSEPRGY